MLLQELIGVWEGARSGQELVENALEEKLTSEECLQLVDDDIMEAAWWRRYLAISVTVTTRSSALTNSVDG